MNFPIITSSVASNENVIYRFRGKVTLSDNSDVTLRLFADSRYKLYVNGVYVYEGPISATENYYDEFSTDAFTVGENEVEAEVLYAGGTMCMSGIKRGRCVAFSLSVMQNGETVAETDENWEVGLDRSREFYRYRMVHPNGYANEKYEKKPVVKEIAMALLTCEKLALGYDGNVILQDLSFQVEQGAYLCIIGENGSGKSTLMRTILGLQPALGGKISTGDGLKQTQIGYLPQQTVVQRDFPASVWEIVLSGCQSRCGLRPFYSKEEKATAMAAMKRMGITALTKRCYRELSGGQQQRVLLARALCATQKLLLLDEPVSGLDPKVTAEMYHLIETLNREDGITVIMISHDMEAAVNYALVTE